MPANPPLQLSLPLPRQPPSPGEVDAELARMWQARPGWRERWKTLDALLRCPDRAKAMRACVRQALLCRRGLAPAPKRPTTRT